MTVESATNFDELNASLPPGTDPVSEGDDHLRLLKNVIKLVFPSNDGPGSFPGMDFFFRDLDARTATFTGQIQSNEQVAIGLTTVNGVTGAITGPQFGVNAVQKVAAGEYEFNLAETGWSDIEDLQIGCMVDYALGGPGVFALRAATTNPTSSWVKVVTAPANDPTNQTDCAILTVVFFDAGRD